LWKAAKWRAQHKGLLFSITHDDIRQRYEEAQVKWRVLGVELGIEYNSSLTTKHASPYLPSLDQVIAGSGYTKENIQIVPWFWNCFKSDYFTDDEAMAMCIRIAEGSQIPSSASL
jgi:hypothetical protein